MHDAISTIIFWSHIWRQKSSQTLCLQSHAQLQLLSFHMIRYNFLIKARFDIYYLVPCLASGIIQSYLSYILWKVERLQAELVQVSKGKKMQQIFDVGRMAPKKRSQTLHLFLTHCPIDSMFSLFFAAIIVVEKLTNLLHSINNTNGSRAGSVMGRACAG